MAGLRWGTATSSSTNYGTTSWSLVQRHPGEVAVWRLEHPAGVPDLRYLKVAVASRFPRLLEEGARMRWACPHLPVPQVLECASDGNVDWLVTAALPGRPASDELLQADPERLVMLLAQGLRQFHAAPVEGCPFDFTVDTAIAHAQARVRAGLVDPGQDFHPEHAHLDAHGALAALRRLRPSVATQDLVVCHGDYCPPNVLVSGTGGGMAVSGFVDTWDAGIEKVSFLACERGRQAPACSQLEGPFSRSQRPESTTTSGARPGDPG